MQFTTVDTQSTYARMLAAPDAAAREAIFLSEIATPFAGMMRVFGGGDPLPMFEQWGMSPEHFGGSKRASFESSLGILTANDAWTQAADALDDAQRAFAPYADRIPLDAITFALVLADLSAMPTQRGYTGFGGIPGYIMLVYDEPNAYNLARLKGATVHELLHNIHFTVSHFNMMTTTVGEYIIAEGLAESFARELYGDDVLGYYVTDFHDAQLATAKQVIHDALNVTGFNEIRGYIFGDTLAAHMGFPARGVPDFAGYAVGYRVVQQYLQRTGKTVPDAVFVPWQEIIAGSGYFDGSVPA